MVFWGSGVAGEVEVGISRKRESGQLSRSRDTVDEQDRAVSGRDTQA